MTNWKIYKIERKSLRNVPHLTMGCGSDMSTSYKDVIDFFLDGFIDVNDEMIRVIQCEKVSPFDGWEEGYYIEVDLDNITTWYTSNGYTSGSTKVRLVSHIMHDKLKEKYDRLEKENSRLERECRNLRDDRDDWKEKYEEKVEELHGEKLRHANEINSERTRHAGDESRLQTENTRLQEKLESSNARAIDLTRRLTNSEEQRDRLLLRLDEKNNQLITLRGENAEKDSELREKERELERKNEEIERLKRQGGLSQEELLTEKLNSERQNLELFTNELRINLEQIQGLTRYHERLFQARKDFNQANIVTHQDNIARVKQELLNRQISIVNVQEVCRKCNKIAELNWELNQLQEQQFEARQEIPTNQ